MGNKNTTPFQPLINTPTGIVCPICFKICKRFEKLHPTNGDQDHFVCFSCNRELIANKRNTHCPLCKTKMYPFPIVFYYQCDLCYRIKTQFSLNHSTHLLSHPNYSFCNICISNSPSCPVCNKTI